MVTFHGDSDGDCIYIYGIKNGNNKMIDHGINHEFYGVTSYHMRFHGGFMG